MLNPRRLKFETLSIFALAAVTCDLSETSGTPTCQKTPPSVNSGDLLLMTMADVLSARLAFVFLLAARKVFDLSSDYVLKP